MPLRIGSALTTLALGLGLAACTSDDSTTVVTGDPVGDAVDDGHAHGVELANQIAAEFSIDDQPTVIAQTGAMLRALNDGEIETSAFAVQVLIEDDIFRFANDMIATHEDANIELDQVMRIYGVGFVPTQAEANLRADAAAEVQELRLTAPQDIDFAYTELQVRMHASAQVVLDQLDAMVEAGPMIDYIANARAMVDDHLGQAEALLASFF
jgi:predicted outer membrane protein